ncbi:Rpp14/Pop5 family protein [Candidatus Bathyarchaeota archaeon]|nr:Rpp14/Pop5 family protein [Candidatus Bathyarchaeota archaeon]
MRRRYLAIEAKAPQSLKDRDLMNAIWEMIHKLFGELGASQTALSFIEYDDMKRRIIIRCSHNAVDIVRTAVAAITVINKAQATLRVIAVSGTLKRLRAKVCDADSRNGHSS